jgi:hypothetical protein
VQKAQVAAAYQSGRQAGAAVEKYYFATTNIPATLEAAGASAHPADNKAVELIQLNPENAQIRVLTRIASAHGQGALVFTPSLDEGKRMVWKCSAEDLNVQALPQDCR